MKVPTLLFKFGELKHLQALQLRGLLYLNTWSYFKDCESDIERDGNEGSQVWFNPSISSIVLGGRELTRAGGTLSASISFADPSLKIFCASAFYRDEHRDPGPILDPSVLHHGPHVLVIHNPRAFLLRLIAQIQALRSDGVITQSGAERIEYFDENTYDGEVGPFRKASRFAREKEWRLALRTASLDDGPFQFEIGSIADIAALKETAAFENRIARQADGFIQVCL